MKRIVTVLCLFIFCGAASASAQTDNLFASLQRALFAAQAEKTPRVNLSGVPDELKNPLADELSKNHPSAKKIVNLGKIYDQYVHNPYLPDEHTVKYYIQVLEGDSVFYYLAKGYHRQLWSEFSYESAELLNREPASEALSRKEYGKTLESLVSQIEQIEEFYKYTEYYNVLAALARLYPLHQIESVDVRDSVWPVCRDTEELSPVETDVVIRLRDGSEHAHRLIVRKQLMMTEDSLIYASDEVEVER